MYFIIKFANSSEIILESETNGRWCIPMDEDNTDYQTYLQWLAAGNEPEIIDLSE